jgi:hypothetical protein
MSDVVEDLKYTPVPLENREKWCHDVMCRAAEEIIKLREENAELRKITSDIKENREFDWT